MCQSLVDSEGLAAVQAAAEEARRAAQSGDWENATEHWAYTEVVVIERTHGVDFYNIHEFHDYWTGAQHDDDDDDKPELRLVLGAAGRSKSAARFTEYRIRQSHAVPD